MAQTSLICSGHRAGQDACMVIEKSQGELMALSYAGGILSGITDYIVQKHGPSAAYDLVSGMADEVLNRQHGWDTSA